MNNRFFFDRNLSPRLARMIDGFDTEHAVEWHDNLFDKNTKDTEWIRRLGDESKTGKRWCVVSGDGRILRNKVEMSALKEAGLPFFIMKNSWLSMVIEDQAWKLVKIWPEILNHARTARPHSVFEVTVNSKIEPIEFPKA